MAHFKVFAPGENMAGTTASLQNTQVQNATEKQQK